MSVLASSNQFLDHKKNFSISSLSTESTISSSAHLIPGSLNIPGQTETDSLHAFQPTTLHSKGSSAEAAAEAAETTAASSKFDFSNTSPTRTPASFPFKHSKLSSLSIPYNYSRRTSISSVSNLSLKSSHQSLKHYANEIQFNPPDNLSFEDSNMLSSSMDYNQQPQQHHKLFQHDQDHAHSDPSSQEQSTLQSEATQELDNSKTGDSSTYTTSNNMNSISSNNNAPSGNEGEDNSHHNNPNSNQFVASLATSQPIAGYPFLRALHGFDASSLVSDVSDPEEDPANICLSFQESEVVLLHSIHPSGWGDATVLSTGTRGWIPTNYFTPYTDSKVTPLLSAVLSFAINPKSHPVSTEKNGEFTFSQSAITNIVAGVRSLLEACGTLTRDTSIIKKSQAIRKFRKILLAELAIFVSLAKQYRNTIDDFEIEKLITGSYKVVSRAVVFLDIWTIDTSNSSTGEEHDVITMSSSDNLRNTEENSIESAIPDIANTHAENTFALNTQASTLAKGKSANRESVIFHKQSPYARQRLEEVNEALTSYLGNFIHRMTNLETDPAASTQILVNTRKSMLACRELLAAVESISLRVTPKNVELETSKDLLFDQIRTLVTAARDVVVATPESKREIVESDNQGLNKPVPPLPPSANGTSCYSEEGRKLIDIATDCAKTSGECVVKSRQVLEIIGDFQLPSTREYPDFSDGVIAVANHRKRSSVVLPNGSITLNNTGVNSSEEFDANSRRASISMSPIDGSNLLPNIPSMSPIIASTSDPSVDIDAKQNIPSSVLEEDAPQQLNKEGVYEFSLEDQVIIDASGRVRGGSLDGLVRVLTDETVDQDPSFVSTFFLSFRQFSNSIDFADALVKRYGSDIDENALTEDERHLLTTRRTKVFNMFKRWMESYWKQSIDVVVLPQIVNFANSNLLTGTPNASAVLNDLAAKVQLIKDGDSIVPRSIPVPGSHSTRMAALAYSQKSIMSSTVSRHLASLLTKAASQVENQSTAQDVAADPKSAALEESAKAGSTWSRMVKSNTLSSLANSSSSSNAVGVSILDIEPADIARQLCLIDNSIFCRIKPEELIDLNFSLKRRHLGLAPNVVEMTGNSNQLSSFVGETILSAGSNHNPSNSNHSNHSNTNDNSPKIRRNLIKYWIKVADKLKEYHNYNSLMTIVFALQSVNIMRLKRTWEMVPDKYITMFQELKAVVAMEKNYATYRALLRTYDIPTVPYLGIYLTDLTFVMEGNSTHRPIYVSEETGKIIMPASAEESEKSQRTDLMVINFDRYERTAKIIGEIQTFQVGYRMVGSPELQVWLKAGMLRAFQNATNDQNSLWRRSCIVEPKE